MKQRIYKYDNVKAILIFLVVVGHLTTDYVSVAHSIRWTTLWIYTFHMPAFIMISGLLHKKYITEEQSLSGIKGYTELRWNKVIGFLLCGYGLKIFIYVFRIVTGEHPTWHWFAEPSVPWYMIVLAEYEIILFLLRKFDGKLVIAVTLAISAVIGYFPSVGDDFCLSRMINFLPIFLIGYYTDSDRLLEISEKARVRIIATVIIVISVVVCYAGPWKLYSLRKWFTGRRSYEFLEDFFPGIMPWAWAVRLAVWTVAILLALSIIIIVPNRRIMGVSVLGERSLAVYFWHRPFCYLICNLGLFTVLDDCFGTHLGALMLYLLIAVIMTALFSLKAFVHPAKDLLALGNAFFKGKA